MLSLDIDQRYIFSLGYIFSNFDLYLVGGKGNTSDSMHSFFLRIVLKREKAVFKAPPSFYAFILSKYRISVLNRFIHCLSRLAQKGRAVFKAPPFA